MLVVIPQLRIPWLNGTVKAVVFMRFEKLLKRGRWNILETEKSLTISV